MKEKLKINSDDHPYNLKKAMEQFEMGYLKNILQLCNGRNAEASEMLGISLDSLESKIEKYNISI